MWCQKSAVRRFLVTFDTLARKYWSISTAPSVSGRLFNHLIGILNSQSNSNTVIGTLAVDGWAVTFGTAMRALGGLHHAAERERDARVHPSRDVAT